MGGQDRTGRGRIIHERRWEEEGGEERREGKKGKESGGEER